MSPAPDEMMAWLGLFRACWLAGIPCHEMLNNCRVEWHRELVLSEYARLEMAIWKPKAITPKGDTNAGK